MATTTASVSISSNDLQPGNRLSINATSTLMKTGLTTGLELMDMGKGHLTTATAADALIESSALAGDHDSANYFYLCNNATDDTFHILVAINATDVGRLNAGEWMFIPYAQADAGAEINITASGGTCPYEYAIFKSASTLAAATA
tara:strand:+ start:478 stop:912 length:435 start_codon:yes stop_codon:yes gene_type:complete